VTPVKAHRIRRLAGSWLARYRVGACAVRFDVISVLWRPTGRPLVQHIKDAF
jgi:putative endonuclease